MDYPLPAKNAERMIPHQMAELFMGEDFCGALEQFTHSVLLRKTVADKWDIVGKPGLAYATFGTELGALHFYQMLIRLGGYKRVLELGTFIGVSTLFLAEAVGTEGHVVSVEVGVEFHGIAQANVERNGYVDRVTLVRARAQDFLRMESIASIGYDLILMDAAKQSYGEMLSPALRCLRPGGLLLVDDVLMNGDVLNPVPTTPKGVGVRKLIEDVGRLDWAEYLRVILPIGNGLLMIHRSA